MRPSGSESRFSDFESHACAFLPSASFRVTISSKPPSKMYFCGLRGSCVWLCDGCRCTPSSMVHRVFSCKSACQGSPYCWRIVDTMGCVALPSSSLTVTSLSTECHLPCTRPPPQTSATTVRLFPLVEVKRVLHPGQSKAMNDEPLRICPTVKSPCEVC